MARDPKSFSIQLDDIPNPQGYERASAAIERSGQAQGEAAILGQKAQNLVVGGLFEAGVGAVKGYAEADIAERTKEAAGRFEDAPEIVEGREAAATVAEYDEKLATGAPAPAQEDPLVTELRNKAAKYRLAESQGLLTRREAITRMEAAVKEWSAMMPGLQSEFRKAAWNEVGISNVDQFLIHQALTTESAREKAAAERAKNANRYLLQVADYNGIPPATVTPKHMELFFASKQLENKRVALENESKIVSADTEKNASRLDALINNKNADSLAKLSSMFTTYDQLNLDPSKSADRDRLRTQIHAFVGASRRDMDAYISTHGATLGISIPELQKRSSFATSQMDSLQKHLETQEGFDSMRRILGRDKDSAEAVMNRFTLAFPGMVAWGKIGVAPALFNTAMAPGGAKTLEKVLGKAGAAEFTNLPANMEKFINLETRKMNPEVVAAHGPLDLRGAEGASYDPETKRMSVQSDLYELREFPKNQNKTQAQYGKLQNKSASLTRALDPGEPTITEEFNVTFDNPDLMADIQKLSQEGRNTIAAPIVARFEQPIVALSESVKTMVNEYNDNPDNPGFTMSVQLDPSGRLVPVVKDASGTTVDESYGRSQGMRGGLEAMFQLGPQEGGEHAGAFEAKEAVSARLKLINTNMKALGHAHAIMGDTSINRRTLNTDVVKQIEMDEPIKLAGVRQQAEKATTAAPTTEKGYQELRDKHMFQSEGVRMTVYQDNSKQKNPTIGVGFNLNRKGADATLSKVLDMTPEEVKEVRTGRKELSEDQVRRLYAHTIEEAEKIVASRFKGVALTPEQRMVATSLAFNGGPELIPADGRFVNALKNGNVQAAVNEVLYYSGTDENKALAKRRYEEAKLLARRQRGVVVPTFSVYKDSIDRASKRNPATLGVRG